MNWWSQSVETMYVGFVVIAIVGYVRSLLPNELDSGCGSEADEVNTMPGGNSRPAPMQL